MFLCSIKPDGTGQYISAGHNPAYVYRAKSAAIEELPSTSLVLGAFDFANYESAPVRLDPGDVLMAYSDGLTEAESIHDEMFGEDRVKQIMRRDAPGGVKRLQEALIGSVSEFTRGREQSDDLTIVIAEQAS